MLDSTVLTSSKKKIKIDESFSFLRELQMINEQKSNVLEAYYDDENVVLRAGDHEWVSVPYKDREDFFKELKTNHDADDYNYDEPIYSLLDAHGNPKVTVFMVELRHHFVIDYISGLQSKYEPALKQLFHYLRKKLNSKVDFDIEVIEDYPSLASLIDCGEQHHVDLIHMLSNTTIAKHCDLSTLDGDMWFELLLKLPKFINHKQFDKSKMDQQDIEELFGQHPELKQHPKFK